MVATSGTRDILFLFPLCAWVRALEVLNVCLPPGLFGFGSYTKHKENQAVFSHSILLFPVGPIIVLHNCAARLREVILVIPLLDQGDLDMALEHSRRTGDLSRTEL